MRVVFSSAAANDLADIALYIAQDNPTRALSFVDEIEARCHDLARMPDIGTLRPDLAPSVRMLPHGRYLIFYRSDGAELLIARVLHGARELTTGLMAFD